jgi:hypothetical protein
VNLLKPDHEVILITTSDQGPGRIVVPIFHPPFVTFHFHAEHLAMNAGIRAKWFINGCYQVRMKYI